MSAPYPLVRNLIAFSTRRGVRASPSRSGSSPSCSSNCRMRSCIRVLYIALFCGLAAGAAAQTDPDALYRERATPGRAEAAVEVWAAQLAANAKDFDAAWKIARATYWIGTHGPAAARRAALERGVAA